MSDQYVYDLLNKQATRLVELERKVEKLTCAEYSVYSASEGFVSSWKLVPLDGSPNPAFSVNDAGYATFPTGASINQFSSASAMTSDNTVVPTASAVKLYVDSKAAGVDPGHTHSKIVGVTDGTPNPSLSTDTDGNLTAVGGLSVGGTWFDLRLYVSLSAAVTAIGATQATLLISTSATVSDDLIIPITLTLRTIQGGMITVATTKTLTINGPFEAGVYQVFTCEGTGKVVFGSGSVEWVCPEWWGADPVGVADSYAAFVLAVASLPHGGTIFGSAQASYFLSSAPTEGITITTSHLTLDGRGATVHREAVGSGHRRFVTVDGDPGVDGGDPQVEDVHTRNWDIGLKNDASNKMVIGLFTWTKDCSIENIIKRGLTNTSLTVKANQRFTARDMTIYGASDGGFGILHHLSDECVYDNCHMLDGALYYGLQIKGGRNNIVQNCSVMDLVDDGVTTPVVGFRDRGDSPWEATTDSGTYPWADKSWTVADSRRASINTRYINCRVEDCTDVIAYLGQESYGTTWENCSYKNVESGWAVKRLDIANSAETDYKIINPIGAVTTGGYGISIAGASALYLPNVKVLGGTLRTSWLDGILIENADDTVIDGTTVLNSSQAASGTYRGIYAASSNRPKIVMCSTCDDQGASATQAYGIGIGSAVIDPTIINNCASGNVTGPYLFTTAPPGIYGDNLPAEGVGQTTGSTVLSTMFRMSMTDGDLTYLEALAVGDQSDHSNRAIYKQSGLYYCASGSAMLAGSSFNTIFSNPANSPVDADALRDDLVARTIYTSASTWGGLSFNTVDNVVRVQVQGAANTTINWNLFIKTKKLG